MNYVRASELARRCGISRAAVSKAIKDQRISPEHIRRQGNTLLVELYAGLKVLGHHAPASQASQRQEPPQRPAEAPQMAAMFAWGSPARPVPAVEQPAEEAQHAPEIGAILARERAWIETYDAFRRWITDGFTMEIMRGLSDPAPVGDVMVLCRQLLLGRMRELDETERRSRFSPEQLQRRS